MARKKIRKKISFLVGVDEAGRGPLAGPLSVGAVCVRSGDKIILERLRGVRDSKKISPEVREFWLRKFKAMSRAGHLTYAVSFVSPEVIDKKGMAYALRLATGRVIKKIVSLPKETLVLLDGSLFAPKIYPHQKTIIGGDDKEPLISSASIVAKVLRDRKMVRLAQKYPGYSFEIHKGYGTKAHYRAIRKKGLSKIHRRSFLKKLN